MPATHRSRPSDVSIRARSGEGVIDRPYSLLRAAPPAHGSESVPDSDIPLRSAPLSPREGSMRDKNDRPCDRCDHETKSLSAINWASESASLSPGSSLIREWEIVKSRACFIA